MHAGFELAKAASGFVGQRVERLDDELEGHCCSRMRSSDDFREGVEVFHGKRNPNFVGT